MSRAIAALGDAALLLPAWVLLALALVAARRLRSALIWSAAIVVCAGATLVAKLVFHACGPAISDLDVVSPSGHVSLASVFYGGLAIMIGVGRARIWHVALALGTLALLGLIGASRIRTGAHSADEVVIGFAIGGLVVALFAVAYLRVASQSVPVWPLALVLVVALAVLGGRHFSLEPTIGRAARRIAAAVDICSGPAAWQTDRRLRIGRAGSP